MKNSDKIAELIGKGKLHFILRYGVTFWGLSTAFLVSAIDVILYHEKLTFGIMINFVIFPIGGVIWGLFMWRYYNRMLQKKKKESFGHP